MTKTEARAWLKRARQAIRDAETALRQDDAEGLLDAVQELGGAGCEIGDALVDARGDGASVAGMRAQD